MENISKKVQSALVAAAGSYAERGWRVFRAKRNSNAFLNMSPEVLRQKVKAGDVPGAKPGKCWVFLEDDLAEYIRTAYGAMAHTIGT